MVQWSPQSKMDPGLNIRAFLCGVCMFSSGTLNSSHSQSNAVGDR